ncbi:hypothetical protein B6V75_03195 [Thioclava sp. F1Mire-8]|uniref:hypothetical protein n=1 Tax=Thioclava sp. F1Mire-8 TaxID=1973006 RepID=UPI000B53BC0F|nr:hypothetical protein [Thioclava sp. F1Mire-8]OWY05153.1 hypothetical protein B6V75_03195 [Thioclava sp. F1Mire-8]
MSERKFVECHKEARAELMQALYHSRGGNLEDRAYWMIASLGREYDAAAETSILVRQENRRLRQRAVDLNNKLEAALDRARAAEKLARQIGTHR